jgi:hypothetical protein
VVRTAEYEQPVEEALVIRNRVVERTQGHACAESGYHAAAVAVCNTEQHIELGARPVPDGTPSHIRKMRSHKQVLAAQCGGEFWYRELTSGHARRRPPRRCGGVTVNAGTSSPRSRPRLGPEWLIRAQLECW